MFTSKNTWAFVFMIMIFGSLQASGRESLLKLLANNIEATSDDANCLECHPDVADNTMNYLHYPAGAGACSYCHTAKPEHLGGDNPPGSVSINKKAENCYTCHERKDENPVLHGALADADSCVSCHNPHSSNVRSLLRATTVPALCSNCHDISVQGKSQHGPVINGQTCLNCHTPHSGKHQKLLHKPAKDLCLACHNKEIQASLNGARTIPNIQKKLEMAGAHPGAAGSCLDCHKAHTSENNRLLTAAWSVKNYNTYLESENPYSMCFTCHETNMLKKTDFVPDTNFRNDTKALNLHWFHVVDAAGSEDKSRGRSCKICHDPHGAPQSHDINNTWFMNGNPIKIEYQLIDNGGQCTKSCHATRQYRRNN
ncbi:MAG: hypothetical protein HYV97_06365 [Bdellovibrio sp.]|nr:hypothetical protein [Bdellovibrio sp.]